MNFQLDFDAFNWENGDIRWRLYRGTTALGTEQVFTNEDEYGNASVSLGGAFTFLDSPSTTSATTYNLKYKMIVSAGTPSATITDTMLTVMEVD